MKTFGILLALSTLALATPFSPCGDASAQVYMSSGPCTVGSGPNQLTLYNVTWSSLSFGDFKNVPASDIILRPSISGGGHFLGLSFEPSPASALDTGDDLHMIDATLHYLVDPPPPILDGFGVSLDPSGPWTLDVILLYGAKVPPQHVPTSIGSLAQSFSGDGNDLPLQTFSIPLSNWVDVTLHLTLGNGEKGSASQGGTTSIESIEPLSVPEPAAFGFVGTGLTALLVLRRRFAR